ncbi:MAG: S9 family peptidase [Sphingomonadales bacterium]
MKIRYLFVLGASFAMSAVALAEGNKLKLEQWLDYERVSNPQISPNGEHIVYTRSHVDQYKDTFTGSLWMMDEDGNKNRFLTEGAGADWSGDSSRIAFTKKAGQDGTEIFVRWMDSEGAVSQITHFEYSPSAIEWSPNGKWIAFKATVPFESDWKISIPKPPKGGKWTEEPTVVERKVYRRDRVGYLIGNDHLFIVPSNGGTVRQITEGDWTVRGGYEWTPDSKTLVFSANTEKMDPNFSGEANIYKVDVSSHDISKISDEKGTWSNASVSPDGKSVIYGGSQYANLSFKTPEVRVSSIDGGRSTALLVDPPKGPGKAYWAKNGKSVYFGMDSAGSTNIYNLDLKGKLTKITDGRHRIGVSSVSDNGLVAASYSNPMRDGIIATTSFSKNATISEIISVNDDIFDDTQMGRVDEIFYKSNDGTDVKGWVNYPPDFDPSKKYPLVLSIHGGPHGNYANTFQFRFQEFAANGNIVLYTDPRGSTSYGSAFAQAIQNEYPGRKDFEDIMSGVDHVISMGNVDADRMFVTGCSGGGVLTTWIVGHTDRFKAAAALCPVTDWIGFTGSSDSFIADGLFNVPFWESPEMWQEHSPIMYVHKVKTPTLLMVGELDLRTPAAEAEKFYHALVRLNVPTKLIYMKGEYHGTTRKPSNMLRTQKFLQKWFDDWDKKPIS